MHRPLRRTSKYKFKFWTMVPDPFGNSKSVARQLDIRQHEIHGKATVIEHLDCFVRRGHLDHPKTAISQMFRKRHPDKHFVFRQKDRAS